MFQQVGIGKIKLIFHGIEINIFHNIVVVVGLMDQLLL
jgi:hypothetical protein